MAFFNYYVHCPSCKRLVLAQLDGRNNQPDLIIENFSGSCGHNFSRKINVKEK